MGLVNTILNQKYLSSADWGNISKNRMKIVKRIAESTLNNQDESIKWFNFGEGEYMVSASIKKEDSGIGRRVTIPVIYKRGKNKFFTDTQVFLGTQGNININLANTNVQKLCKYFSEVEESLGFL